MPDSNPDFRVAGRFEKGHFANSIVLITAEYGKLVWPIKDLSLRRSISGNEGFRGWSKQWGDSDILQSSADVWNIISYSHYKDYFLVGT